MTPPWQFYISEEPWNEERKLFIVRAAGTHRKLVPEITFTRLERGEPVLNPVLTCNREQREDNMDPIHGLLQGALDFAWAQGMRPTDWKPPSDATAELAAVRYHLEDMRVLAKIPAR